MHFQSRNPATGELLEAFTEHSADDIESRLMLSFAAWKRWSRASLQQRTEVLRKLGALLEERADRYGRLITQEMGKSLVEAVLEVRKAAAGARHFAEHGAGYLAPMPIEGMNAKVVYESLGPVFGVMPWNLPFWQVLRFFIPTAMAGNTVLVKHAETVQGCAHALEQLILDAGAPEGLYLNLAIRRGGVARVVRDPRVRCVTVTGSTQAGRAVAQEAGAYGKKAVLELGGSDPFIVLEDADLDRAVQLGVTSRFSNNAQSCIAAKRFLVAEPIAEVFQKKFVEKAAALRMGDPMSVDTQLGPLARADLRDEIHRQVLSALKQGGTLLTGGAPVNGPGNFYPPTVITGLSSDAPIAQEEIFGPVAMLFTFRTDEEAIALANATEFGLGATVCSADVQRANKIASALEVGAVFINDFVRSDPRAPFGGVKGSGFGRELGALGARELANAKLVVGG
ncbi:NAD-dependent succinate-semialdehyde dehydrogenase [Burkholderia cenocepacia]|uniref:NAD-dependent succinate-semialdehyde dehydrogenase n=1 Tax=Burkholderia cenocepacia TaxID=95486 RepID=UPI0009809CD6|nr:NAD-dependent succinate-semialdehyde dehydrogenase [Burkholderia cenocepacia]ONR61787.1 aldehyde dehydrogenase [Burkholderia cenocepacia]ONR61992.1 aldehyde dehydrogenase [Burkholderia cenocepacia]ONR76657.1 aldehyde dehydrogenase [Burkholderia cenocepacia]ONR94850.1 aldehyde dehydrogenase [Burkholderia cenocepacia]ONR97935.1 aldehyde dehydrogenase [Burkholderia cenocepacia]